MVETLDPEGKHQFTIRGYQDYLYTNSATNPGSLTNRGAPFPELAQLVPKDNAGYTLYDLKGLILADGESATLTIEITDPRGYAGFAVTAAATAPFAAAALAR